MAALCFITVKVAAPGKHTHQSSHRAATHGHQSNRPAASAEKSSITAKYSTAERFKLSAQLSSIFKGVKQFGSSFDLVFLTAQVYFWLFSQTGHTLVFRYMFIYLIYVFNINILFFFEEIKEKIPCS